MAQVWIDGVGFIDDGSGDSGAYNYTPPPPDDSGYFSAGGQFYFNDPAPAYNPPPPTSLGSSIGIGTKPKSNPFELPTVADFYTQESQSYTQPIPKVNPWDFSKGYYDPQPQPQVPSVAGFYEQESQTKQDPFSAFQPDYQGGPPQLTIGSQQKTHTQQFLDQLPHPVAPFEAGQDNPFLSLIQGQQAATAASNQGQQNITDPWEFANEAGKLGLGVLGAIPAAGYGLLSGAANSNIPGVSQAAGAVRNAFDQVISPVFNALPSTVGDVAAGRVGPGAPFTKPFEPKQTQLQRTVDAISAAWDPQQAAEQQTWLTQQGQAFLANELAQGKSEKEAQQNTQAYITKMSNPFNYAQEPGLQEFSQLPAIAQLGIGLFDPVGNALAKAGMERYVGGAPKVIGRVAQKTGAARVIDQVLENTVRAPEQKAYRFGQVSDRVISTLDEEARKLDLNPADILPDFLFNKASPLYYEKVMPGVAKDRLAQETIDRVSYAYNNSPLFEAGKKDPVKNGEKVAIAQSKLGIKAQDTSGTVDPFTIEPPGIQRSTFDPNNLPPMGFDGQRAAWIADWKDQRRQQLVKEGKAQYDASKQTDAEAGGFRNAIQTPEDLAKLQRGESLPSVTPFPAKEITVLPPVDNAASKASFAENLPAKPVEQPAPLPKKYEAIKLPQRGASEAAEFFNAAKTMQAVDVKALLPKEGTKTPTLRPALPLEEWGKLGSTLRGFNRATTQPLSRVYLESLSRAVRDPASNYLKLGIVDPGAVGSQVMRLFGLGDANAVNSRFKTIFGDVEPLGPASMSAEVGGGRTGKESGIGNLLYHAANPLNELSADVLRKAIPGDKFHSYSKFIEDNETSLKQLLYKREALRVYDEAVKAGPKTEFFQKNPWAYKAIQNGTMTRDMLDRLIQGRVFRGFDLNDLANNKYNPANLSEQLAKEMEPVAGGLAGTYGEILKQGIGSITDRVDAENARLLEAQRKVAGYYRAKTPKAKELADANARANAKLIRLEDVDSSHPIVQQMIEDTLNAYDANRVALFPKDTKLYDAAKYLIDRTVNYAFDKKRYDLFSSAFKDAQTAREAFYAARYNAPPTEFERMMDLKDKYEATAGLTPQEIRALPKDQRLTQKEIAEFEAWQNKQPLRQQAADAGVDLPEGESGPGLPQPTPGPKVDYASLYDQVYNPPAVRFKADQARGGKTMGVVLSPDAMRKMAAKFNRTETLTAKGDVYNPATSRGQMNRWFQDFMATDQYYRQISDNTFKLDPDTLGPVRISDGSSLEELVGKTPPPRIGPEIPPLPAEIENVNIPDFLDAMKARYGEDAGKGWGQMDPENRDIIIQEISRSLLGIDPLNPLTNPKGSAEHAKAVEMLQKFLDDMDSRKAKYAEDVQTGQALQGQFDLDMKTVTDSLLAERFQAAYQAKTAAYDKVKGSFFDYRDKNRIDQALGTILPFQYWARQNFAYLARHFAANPYHFAVLLNFYKELEQENSDPTIPGYSKYNIHLAQGNGQHWMWDYGSLFFLNPLGDNQSFGGLVSMTDDELARAKEDGKIANSQPFGLFDPSQWGQALFGKDKVNAQGKVTGRDKGLASSWLRFNPAIQDFLQTGIPNKWMADAGWLGKGNTLMGQDYPEDTRGQHERLGIVPAATQYRSFGAQLGVTGALRNAGIIKGDFDPEAPLNEIAYGRNAGKPQTAIYQELVRMTANKEISDEEAKKAIIAYKSGAYDSKALLAAMDRVEADDAPRKLLSMIGFNTLLTNTPREQVTNNLYGEMNKAYDQLPAGYKLDEKGNAVAGKSPVSDFYDKNPAASVLSAEQSNDTPESIAAGIASDKAYDAIAKLKAQLKAGEIDQRAYSSEMDKLQGANPAFFEKNSYYNTTAAQDKQAELTAEYKAIGGGRFDEMQTEAYGLKNAGDEDGYKKIVNSKQYKDALNQRSNFITNNPDWYARYTEGNRDYATERNSELVGGLARTNAQLAPKPAKDLERVQQDQLSNQYYDIGGDKFDQMQAKAFQARDNGDDATYKKLIASPEYIAAQKKRNEFIYDHPDWYEQYSQDRVKSGGTGKYSGPLPPTSDKAIPRLTPKPPKSIDDLKYGEQLSDYYSKGGVDYDKLQADIKNYFDKKEDAKAYAIINSRDYQRVQSTLDQFKLDNPEFAKRFDKEYTAKWGKPPASEDDKIYSQQQAQFYKIGGARYDQLYKKAQDAYDSGDKTTYYDIKNSREYKAMEASRDQYLLDNPEFAQKYNAENTAKYGSTPKTDAQKEYDDLNGMYQSIGGAKYDALYELANQYYEAGNKKAYYAIADSADYQQMKAARKQFLADHPDFAKQYQAGLDAKYGPSSSSSGGSSGSSNSSSSYSNSSGSSSGYTAKKTTSTYTGSSKKPYTTNYRSTNTGTNTKKVTVTSAAGYVNPFKLPVTDSRNPFFIPGKTSAPAAAASRTSFNGTSYGARSSTPSTATPAAPAGGTSTWDAAQKRKYAQLRAQGKSTAYASAAANNYYKKKA